MTRTYILKAALVACFITPPILHDAWLLGSVAGQESPAPAVEWRDIMPLPIKLGWGRDFVPDNNVPVSYTQVPFTTNTLLDPDETGEDWWYAHCNLYDQQGVHIGYATAGYNTAPNWGAVDGTGCFSHTIPDEDVNHPLHPDELETRAWRKGASRCWVARYDLKGEQLWCRTHLIGEYFGVAQSSDGSIVLIGHASTNRMAETPTSNGPTIQYNPGLTTSGPLNLIDCQNSGLGTMSEKMVITKIDLNANVEWMNLYAWDTDLNIGWGQYAHGTGIQPISISGQDGYLLASSWLKTGPGSDNRAALWRLDNSGQVIDRHAYLPGDPTYDATTSETGALIRPLDLDVRTINGVQCATVAGRLESTQGFDAFLWYLPDLDQTPFYSTANGFVHHSNDAVLSTYLNSALNINHSSAAFIADDGGSPAIIWPLLADYDQLSGVFSGRSIATLQIHRFSATGQHQWMKDLGEVRAYDLQADGIQTSDGNIALVSSRWGAEVNGAFTFGSLSPSVQSCLTDVSGFGYDMDPDTAIEYFDWANSTVFDYWATDGYVTKLDLATSDQLWETLIDAEPGVPASCFPGNMKRQECMYKISEASDGGLVLSGNTGHNFDDAFLVKLYSDCRPTADYTYFRSNYPFIQGTTVHEVSGNATWNTDMDVFGIVRVPAGATLTVASNTIIRFADSHRTEVPTRLEVEAGGTLIINSGATLTSLSGCPGSMWDGVLAKGDANGSQDTYSDQAHISLNGTAQAPVVVENARTGILAANAYPAFHAMVALQPVASGAVVKANEAIFRNNQRDVVFSPYENHHPNDVAMIRPNRSRFTRCSFATTDLLSNTALKPAEHVSLFGVRNVIFSGCTWSNNGPQHGDQHISDLGEGLKALNSTFQVTGHCSAPTQPGVPCAPANYQRSTFSGLSHGIMAFAFDPSRTFIVRNTDLTDNFRGIRMEGVMNPSVTECTFDVGDDPFGNAIDPDLDRAYGLYSYQCTGYEIEQNAFFSTLAQPEKKQVGLVIKDSGPFSNRFYNNTFDHLHAGTVIQGKNATGDELFGLEVKCNDYGLVDANEYDVALTGSFVRVQKTQGMPMLQSTDHDLPAGNRFSIAHDGTGHPDEDWSVEDVATVVEYFHHGQTANNRTEPEYVTVSSLSPNESQFLWQSKALSCPSVVSFLSTPHLFRIVSEQEHLEYASSASDYDATKDDGDTYTLVGYVGNASYSSAQVRNALQSVAPGASYAAFEVAFGREPAMDPWHITQALLSNSPLQGEVMDLMYAYELPEFYIQLVEQAQGEEVNVLTLLQSEMALHAGRKSEALADLNRASWTDTVDLGMVMDSLEIWHNYLPSDAHIHSICALLGARGEFNALVDTAGNALSTSTAADKIELLMRWGQAEQNGGWHTLEGSDRIWVEDLAQELDSFGSVAASVWLQALGESALTEQVILPSQSHRMVVAKRGTAARWGSGPFLEAYPNPSSGPVYLVFDVPQGMGHAEIRILDLSGHVLKQIPVAEGPGLVELEQNWLGGMYVAELRLQNASAAQVKLSLIR